MKILLAVDGSELSLRAARALIDHARRFSDLPEVHVLFVHPPVPIGLATHPLSHETLDRYYREEGDAALAATLAALHDAAIAAIPHIHVGDPAPLIARRADELGCDLICIGSHGRGALPNALLGSVASKVLHLAGVPVLVVR